MKVNGKEISLNRTMNLSDFLIAQGYKLDKIAVERNQEIVPKNTYEKVMLTECDVLEIVSFVGGG